VTYRNDSEALRARVDELEGNLAAAEDRIAKLTGAKTSDEVQREIRESKLIGASSGATLAQTFPFEIDTEGYEAIAALVRERMNVEVSQVGHSLTTRGDVFSLRRENGQTTLRLHGNWVSPVGSLVSVGTLSTMFLGLPALGVLLDINMHHPEISIVNAAWLVPSIVGAVLWPVRSRIQKVAKTKLALHQGTFEALRALAEKHAVKGDLARARVAIESEEPLEESESRSAMPAAGVKA
jgi:hypothetical protein